MNLAVNIVAPPKKSKKQIDVKKIHLFQKEEPGDKLKDPKKAAAFLAAIKNKGGEPSPD